MKTKATFLLTVAFIFMFGCAPDPTLNEPYETINGIYHIETVITENECVFIEELDRWLPLEVIVQERREDGSYLVDVYLSRVYWPDVEVAPDGTFEAYRNYYEIQFDTFSGVMDNNTVIGTIHQNFWQFCSVYYSVEGYKAFESMEPPEGMEYR